MFGSNFDANFGIPAFPVEGMDPQGGMFGATAPDQAGGNMPGVPTPPPAVPAATGAQPAAGAPTALGTPSPLSTGALSPGAAAPPPAALPDQNQGTAPAAGIGSPFGKPGV